MTDHVFFEDNATQNVWFLICHFKLPSSPYGVWWVMAAGVLFVGLSYCISRSSMIVALGGGAPRLPWGCAGWGRRGGSPLALSGPARMGLFSGSWRLLVYFRCRLANRFSSHWWDVNRYIILLRIFLLVVFSHLVKVISFPGFFFKTCWKVVGGGVTGLRQILTSIHRII